MSVCLSVSEIERLAKAGVNVTIGDGPGHIWPQPDSFSAPIPPGPHTADPMEKAIWDRWERSRRARTGPYMDLGFTLPFRLLATQHGDKVWVSVHPTNFNYEPFQLTDDSAIYPSDALMAKIALWEREHPSA